MNRIAIMTERLQQALSPTKLEIIDDSHRHIGHAGSSDGAGHFTVIISAECLNTISRVAAHRMIYDALGDLIPKEVHALKIKLDTK